MIQYSNEQLPTQNQEKKGKEKKRKRYSLASKQAGRQASKKASQVSYCYLIRGLIGVG